MLNGRTGPAGEGRRLHYVPLFGLSATNLVPAQPRGLTLSYGIFVRSDHWRDRTLILHELAHIAQYERLGGIEPFLRQYLLVCATVGYSNSGMEDEARPMPVPGGTDPGIQKKLEQTLSGILPSPKKPSTSSSPRIEVPVSASKPVEKAAKERPAEKPAEKPAQ